MDAVVGVCYLGQSDGIGAVQLGQLTVQKNFVNNGVSTAELLQGFCIRGVARLFLFGGREPQLLKQHLAELLGRMNVEIAACHLPDGGKAPLGGIGKPPTVFGHSCAVNAEAALLHFSKNRKEGKLHLTQQLRTGNFLNFSGK